MKIACSAGETEACSGQIYILRITCVLVTFEVDTHINMYSYRYVYSYSVCVASQREKSNYTCIIHIHMHAQTLTERATQHYWLL